MTRDEFTRAILDAIADAPSGPVEPLDVALAMVPADGTALEFGVYRGGTLTRIAGALPRGRVVGFDSFRGLPSDWRDGFPAGAFAIRDLTTVDVPSNAAVFIGLFADTLPAWRADNPGPVDLVHIDCDIYESAACVLDLLADRITPETVLVFDELVNYEGFEDHELRALWEHCERTATEPRIVCSGGVYKQAVALRLAAPLHRMLSAGRA